MKAKSYAELDSASSKNQNTIREEGYTYNANLCNQVLVFVLSTVVVTNEPETFVAYLRALFD